ncbi:MAG TPA: acyl-CoA dehydratase activase [Anaeromyxobacteraceae bacterium]|nr:acyl-CoA dehydratase activase [Anaeromyxobacteraceae bacterium]
MKALAIGVDVGSTTFKAVVLDGAGHVIAYRVEPADPRIEPQVDRLLDELQSVAPGAPIGATGYGRKRVRSGRPLTEITCHARGAFAHVREGGVLLDMGGQDTKVIRFGMDGRVEDFAMNDKCAAGTGRFLEVILARLGVPLANVLYETLSAGKAVSISSTCTVFAESEVVSLIASGEPVAGIVRGLHQALASRVASLFHSGRHPGGRVLMSGGVALNAAMVAALEERLGRTMEVLPQPQLVGAIGAALTVLPSAAGDIPEQGCGPP